MSHKFSMPDDNDLEYLIKQVFESMPDVDQSRLSMIENRLLQKARRDKPQKTLNKIPWWIVLLLAGGFATAAWWAGDLFFDKQESEITDKQTVYSDKISERESSMNAAKSSTEENEQDEQDEQNNETYEDRESPIIYQRESF